MKIITHLSDTHNQHDLIPEFQIERVNIFGEELPPLSGNLIVHSGDATGIGSLVEFENFIRWYGTLNFKYRLFIPGNHDRFVELQYGLAKQMCKDNGIILLHDDLINIDGFEIYGSAWTPEFNNWAFNSAPSELIRHWSKIPENIDILITHGPPNYILDLVDYTHIGDQALMDRVLYIKPRLHLFGHCHYHGQQEFHGIKFYNGALLDHMYTLRHSPHVIPYSFISP